MYADPALNKKPATIAPTSSGQAACLTLCHTLTVFTTACCLFSRADQLIWVLVLLKFFILLKLFVFLIVDLKILAENEKKKKKIEKKKNFLNGLENISAEYSKSIQ